MACLILLNLNHMVDICFIRVQKPKDHKIIKSKNRKIKHIELFKIEKIK